MRLSDGTSSGACADDHLQGNLQLHRGYAAGSFCQRSRREPRRHSSWSCKSRPRRQGSLSDRGTSVLYGERAARTGSYHGARYSCHCDWPAVGYRHADSSRRSWSGDFVTIWCSGFRWPEWHGSSGRLDIDTVFFCRYCKFLEGASLDACYHSGRSGRSNYVTGMTRHRTLRSLSFTGLRNRSHLQTSGLSCRLDGL